MAHQDAYRAAIAADDAYSAELRRMFGKRAGDVRYTKAGKGDPGSELRRLHDAKLAADEAWRLAQRGGSISESRSHHVADFSTLPEIVEHARLEGATYVKVTGGGTKLGTQLYYPREDGQYEEASVWREAGYWHSEASSDRRVIDRLPRSAEPIERFLTRYGQQTVETSRRRSIVADFSTLPELIEHAKTTDGATHILIAGRQAKLYFPRRDGRYDEGTVWQQHGYWHAPAPSDRVIVTGLPNGAEPIGSHTQRVGRKASEARLSETSRRRGAKGALELAGEMSQQLNGSKPKDLPGGFRWSEKNEAAQFTTHSPEYGQKVVVVVSTFPDRSVAVDYFGDEGLSETARYESVGHFTYKTTADLPEMVNDVRWVWETVDGYAASWQEDGGEVDEAKAPRFADVRDMLLAGLGQRGWTVAAGLKVPHATSADGQTRLWFKTQAVYMNDPGTDPRQFDNAHSLSMDMREYKSVDDLLADVARRQRPISEARRPARRTRSRR